MGTSAGNNIDIGVGVHEIAGSAQIVDRLKTKLGELRAEAAKPVQNALGASLEKSVDASAESVGEFTLTIEKNREIMAAVGGDFEKFKAEVLRLKTAHDEARAAAIAHAAAEKTVVVGPAQLNPAVPAQLVQTKMRAAEVTTEINLAIGALSRMGQSANATNRQAVAAFTAESQAAAAYLARLGATDAELKILSSTLTQLERRAGAASIPGVPAATINSYDKLGGRLRTAANASAILGQTAVTGTGSVAGMAAAVGNLTTGIAAFATGGVGIAVAAIGGMVTIITAVVGLTIRWREENEKNRKALVELNTQIFEGVATDRLQQQLAPLDRAIAAARAERDRLAAERKAQVKGTGIVEISAEDVAKATQNLNNLSQRQTTILGVLQKRAQEAGKSIVDAQQKAADEAIVTATERTKGEFAARRVALDQEFAAEKKRLEESGADESKIRASIVALEQKHAQDTLSLEADRAAKLSSLRRAAADRLLVIQAEQLGGEIAAQRKAVELELADKVAEINREVGLESVRGVRIAAARADAINKIDKINREQAQKARELSDEFARGVASSSADTVSELSRAIADANRQRSDDQKKINAIDLGDAAATAIERFNLETEADARQNAAIEKARRDHGEALKRITDDTENGILELTGKASEARRNIINAEFDERVKAAKRLAAPPETIANLETQRGLALAKVDLDDLQAAGTRAFEQLDQELKKTEALSVSGAITEREARERVIDAYTRTREELGRILPDLERIARETKNEDAIAAVEQLKTKYLELGNTLSHVSDGLGKLKSTLRESAQSALETLFVDATKLGTQDTSEVKALAEQLSGARAELNALLADTTRTPEDNKRITELRSEIQQTEVGLERAKDALTSWRDLFLQVAQSIIDALIRVSAQMLATAIIERTLGFFAGLGGGGGGNLGSNLSSGGATGVVHAATGGLMRGPSGVDAIPAMVTAGEFMQPVPSVEYYGEDWMEAQRRRLIPREAARQLLNDIRLGSRVRILEPRRATRFLNEGGLVSAGGGIRQSSVGETHHVRIVAPPGFRLEQINSPEGAQVLVELVSERANAFNAALGRS